MGSVVGCRLDPEFHGDRTESAAVGAVSRPRISQRGTAGSRCCDSHYGTHVPITAQSFFIHIALPYLLVVLIAYVGARVVYGLGTQLKRARELGSYRLIDRIGHGGMGDVWLAQHRLLVRPAAIKLMRPESFRDFGVGRGSELAARFEREAQATSSLRSPHTIELYDFGVADDGTFYYVMELLDGCDFRSSSSASDRCHPSEPSIF